MNNGETLPDDASLESFESEESTSLLCSIQVFLKRSNNIQIPIELPSNQQTTVFWDISSQLNATVQFLIDSLRHVNFMPMYEHQNHEIDLKATETISIHNRGEFLLPTTRLLTVLKSKDTKLSAVKENPYSNLQVFIQHKKERRLLRLTSDVSIAELKEKCLVETFYVINHSHYLA